MANSSVSSVSTIRIVEDQPQEMEEGTNSAELPPHHSIYKRDPRYNSVMAQYEREKERDRLQKENMYKEGVWHEQHRHPKPWGDNRSPAQFLQQKMHPSTDQMLGRNTRIPSNIREKHFTDRDRWWDRKYHTRRGDTYLQTKHRDFDKYWAKQEKDWNKRFHDVGDWSWKPKYNHRAEEGYLRDSYDTFPRELYPRYDKHWNHDWYDHFHSFEGTKRMTLAYHYRYHEEMVRLEDYYHPEIRNLGPGWWLRHLKRQLETDPRPMFEVGNIAEVILDNFPICVFFGRYQKDEGKVVKLIRKYRSKTDLRKDAIIYVSLDNSRAGLKIYSDLKHASPLQHLPQVWLNNRLVGGYDAVKKLARVGRLKHLMREAEFEGKMPCETCQSVVKDWYKEWHNQHYPYFDKAAPY